MKSNKKPGWQPKWLKTQQQLTEETGYNRPEPSKPPLLDNNTRHLLQRESREKSDG